LEGSVDGVARQESLSTEWLIGLLAEVAREAGTIDPLSGGQSL